MLRLVTAPSPSDLQPRVIEAIAVAKAGAPFAPVTILVPSHWLVDHLRHVCAQAAGTLLNVRIWTFHQFAVRFRDELATNDATTPVRADTSEAEIQQPSPVNLTVVDQLFYEQTVRQLLARQGDELASLGAIRQAPGMWAALWATIRDLHEAQVDPDVARRAVGEEYFGSDDREWLHGLFTLSAAVSGVSYALGVGTADDLAESLLPSVAEAPWITSLGTVLYFGFYDLTQVQVSLLEAIARRTTTTLFFPLSSKTAVPHDAFARRFYERSLQPLLGGQADASAQEVDERCATTSRADVAISSAVGSDGELAAVCRRILDLVEQRGYDWDHIGIVARSLDEYRTHLKPVLDRYRIPFRTSATRPLLDHPLAKTIVRLLTLPSENGNAENVLDILTSPFVALEDLPLPPSASVHHAWRQVVAEMGIRRGRSDWERLHQPLSPTVTSYRAASGDLEDTEPEQASDSPDVDVTPDSRRSRALDLSVREQLWRQVERLLVWCEAIPETARIAERVTSCETLLARYVPRPSESRSDNDQHHAECRAVWESIDQALQSVRRLDPLFETLRWDEFAELLGLAFERATIPIAAPDEHRGVRILDGMAARGLSFDALFLIGLNEQVFPRAIREDAFLRDRHRRVLDATLGYKIDEKLAGYDEERLLFHHLCAAGRRHLILSYQRMDDEGRARMPSPYLNAWMPSLGGDPNSAQQVTEVVPRSVREPHESALFRWDLFPPSDLIQRTIAQRGWHALTDGSSSVGNRSIAPLLHSVGYAPSLCAAGGMAVAQLEWDQSGLTQYDGLVGPSPYHWATLVERGVSPTALETYALCPFRYFALRRLRILRPAQVVVAGDVPPPVLGKLLHYALRHTYDALVEQGWPTKPATSVELHEIVQKAVGTAALLCETQEGTGYPLLWKLAQHTTVRLVLLTIAADEASAQDAPFVPIGFEVSSEGRLPALQIGTDDAVTIKVRGTVDRLDRVSTASGTIPTGPESLRIVDYKLRLGATHKTDDRNLARAALRATRLQPPLYGMLEWARGTRAESVQFTCIGPAWDPPIEISTYIVPPKQSSPDDPQTRTIRTLLEGIHQGEFPIVPSDACKRCDARSACRLTHVQTLWRAARSEWVQRLRELQKQDVPSGNTRTTAESAD